MPKSTTTGEGMQRRNEDRVKRLIRVAIGTELDKLQDEIASYRRIADAVKGPGIAEEIKYLEDMRMALRRLAGRFQVNRSRFIPQENRDDDG